MRLQPALFLVAACSVGDPEVEHDSVARIVASTFVTPDGGGTLGAIADSIMLAKGGMPAGFLYETGVATGTHGSVEHSYMMFECRDVNGVLLPACTPASDRARIFVGWAGEVRQPGLVVHTTRQSTWTFANLQYWTPSVSGTGQVTSEATVAGMPYAIVAEETDRMVTPSHMLGGAIDLELYVTRGEEPIAMRASITFDAVMDTAQLTVDDHGYRVDLATGRLVD